MVFEFVLGFVVLVAASYLGTTMALRGFFGREYYEPRGDDGSDGRSDGRPGTDDVPRAGDVAGDEDE